MGQPDPNHGGQSITIGLRDLYDMIQSVNTGYTSLSSKLDTALISQTLAQQSIAQQLADVRHILGDHETRIRVIETRPYISPRSVWAGVSVVTAVLGLLFTILQVVIKQ